MSSKRKKSHLEQGAGKLSTGTPQGYRVDKPLELPQVDVGDRAPPHAPPPITDADIERELKRRLADDARLAGHGIALTVENQIVRLAGTVDSAELKAYVEEQAAQVAGVGAVTSILQVAAARSSGKEE